MNREVLAEQLPILIYEGRAKAELRVDAFRGFLPRLFQRRIRGAFPLSLVSDAANGLLWRDLVATKQGTAIVETTTSPFALQRAGIFDLPTVGFLRAFWLNLPRKAKSLPDLDLLMGSIIRRQILHELLVLRPVDPLAPAIPGVPGKVELSEWELFVLRHTKGSNHFIHLLSAFMFYLSPLLALIFGNPLWLIPFFLSGMVGTFGHFITQDGGVSLRDATTRQQVPLYVLRMFYLIATGRYGRELQAAKAKL